MLNLCFPMAVIETFGATLSNGWYRTRREPTPGERQVLKQMRQSMLSDENEEPGLGSATMLETVDAELSRKLAGQRNGLAPLLMESMGRAANLTAVDPTSQASGAADATAPAREALPTGTAGMSSAADITSPFGWRKDPFTGATRFHAGVDIKASYGTDVSAAASGRVAFAGEQRGYGQTVIIEHSNGVRTRYAYLSHIGVRAGESLSEGDVLGRVGQSRRQPGRICTSRYYRTVSRWIRRPEAHTRGLKALACACRLHNRTSWPPNGHGRS